MNRKILKLLLVGEFSLQRVLRSFLFTYACLCIYAFFFADRLIFQSPPTSYWDTEAIIKLKPSKEVSISALYLPNPKAKYTLLYSHGNAEDLGEIQPILEEIRQMGFAIFAYDYQGYGTSEGVASELATYQDIDAAYKYLTQRLKVPPDRIIAYGRSVGGGPTIDLAVRKPVAGVILESTFVSAFRTVTQIPLFPFDKFTNLDKIGRIRCPVLIVHGKADEVIPVWHGQKLFAAAQEPKRFLEIEQAQHNDILEVARDRYTTAVQDFAALLDKVNQSNKS